MKPRNQPFPILIQETLRAGWPARLPHPLTTLCIATILVGSFALVSCQSMQRASNPPPTAKSVDLQQYAGKWFEIARLPTSFQKADEAAIAEYGMNSDGTLSVLNTAIRPDGSIRDIRGNAKVLNAPENTKLAVRFSTWFGPLIPIPKEGNYWVLHVDETYREAIVGTPDRKFLWILSRTPTVPEPRYSALVAKAEAMGFEVSRLIKSPTHAPAAP